jgi:predicted GH43/DUF377 family glycosyl hydrolase
VVTITRSDIEIRPDPGRVVARPFLPGEATFAGGPTRVELIANRVLALDESEAEAVLDRTRSAFAGRHRDLDAIWAQNARIAESQVPSLAGVDGRRRDLLGAYFTQEYTPEAAAVCNPSIVPFPGVDGEDGFIMSLRAIGEGHISSVEFRTGRVEEGAVTLDPPGELLSLGERRSSKHDKSVFQHKLTAIGADAALVEMVMSRLADPFSNEDLDAALERLDRGDMSAAASFETKKLAHWLASSNYELAYPESIPVSERILLPSSPAESQGIEDARFTRFVRDDGSVSYYATYTAFDGFTILPQLIETQDFLTFRFVTLNGVCARNKGMALFPRKVDGLYAALGRHDQENLHLLRSDRLEVWNHAEMISSPERGWESVQIGACGSPMETDDGWLVITHGVGPMRQYSLGALLLDLDDPSQIAGRLETPLLEPDADERDGYVPNVVYSCGSMIHEGRLIVPYGYADQGVRVMSVAVDELMAAMIRRPQAARASS